MDVDPVKGKAVQNEVISLENSAEWSCSGTSLGVFMQKVGVCL